MSERSKVLSITARNGALRDRRGEIALIHSKHLPRGGHPIFPCQVYCFVIILADVRISHTNSGLCIEGRHHYDTDSEAISYCICGQRVILQSL